MFGVIKNNLSYLKKLEEEPTGQDDSPLRKIFIVDCGEVWFFSSIFVILVRTQIFLKINLSKFFGAIGPQSYSVGSAIDSNFNPKISDKVLRI